ncbi:MAG: hypothetical protein ACREP7_04710 [Lysobacter sp.]
MFRILFSRTRRTALLALALIAASPVAFADSTGSAIIRNGNGTLELHSAGGGVLVAASTPSSFWSYVSGDYIVSVAGRPVHTPEDIFSLLRATSAATVTSQVTRVGGSVTVTLNVRNYRISMPPAPPTPPTPPGA